MFILNVFPKVILSLKFFLACMTHNPELMAITRQTQFPQLCVYFVVFTNDTGETHYAVTLIQIFSAVLLLFVFFPLTIRFHRILCSSPFLLFSSLTFLVYRIAMKS